MDLSTLMTFLKERNEPEYDSLIVDPMAYKVLKDLSRKEQVLPNTLHTFFGVPVIVRNFVSKNTIIFCKSSGHNFEIVRIVVLDFEQPQFADFGKPHTTGL